MLQKIFLEIVVGYSLGVRTPLPNDELAMHITSNVLEFSVVVESSLTKSTSHGFESHIFKISSIETTSNTSLRKNVLSRCLYLLKSFTQKSSLRNNKLKERE